MITPHVGKKLIEVALPLDAINKAAAREKSIRHGHPSTLHLWWARRPLAAARAVIFAQMVDDPSEYADDLLSDPERKREARRELKKRRPSHQAVGGKESKADGQSAVELDGPSERQVLRDMAVQLERERLFSILEDLVRWENTTNEQVLKQAQAEIWQSWRRSCAEHAGHTGANELFDRHALPAFHDPFAGGGALPLEAQRLGLEAHASDLNPVAVLINKAMIEIPPKFAGRAPVSPILRDDQAFFARTWNGAQGLAEDVRYYGRWMRDEAEKRIGHLYPSIEIPAAHVSKRPDLKPYEGRKLKVIAWLWARTVKSPNPAFADVDVPLASTFMLSTKNGKEAYVEPVVEDQTYRFEVKVGVPPDLDSAEKGTKLSRGSFRCLLSNVPIRYEYIDDEANAGRMSDRLMAIVAAGDRSRLYLSPLPEAEATARRADPHWKPDAPSRGTWASNAQGRRYGFRTFGDYFTPRQLVALTTFSALVTEAIERVRRDAVAAGLSEDSRPLGNGGTGATAYAEAVGVYLAFCLDKCTDYWNQIATWMPRGTVGHAFSKQAIPMTWDFPEAAPLGDFHCSWREAIEWVAKSIELLPGSGKASVTQADGAKQRQSMNKVISTDPPYYDNIGYADLSDFFYVWLRRSLKPSFPDLFATVAVPKAEELVATPYRHGSKGAAEAFFLKGMTRAMCQLAEQSHPAFPVTIYYAYKQSEKGGVAGTASTGWETFLDAVIRSGFAISGTWPIRTERGARSIGLGTNALASSIVLVCRRRAADAPVGTRRDFLAELRSELPQAVRLLQTGNIAPVDLAQAAIGPGMAVYTRYAPFVHWRCDGCRPRFVRQASLRTSRVRILGSRTGAFDRSRSLFERHPPARLLTRGPQSPKLLEQSTLRAQRGE